jgi:hypothetical protein
MNTDGMRKNALNTLATVAAAAPTGYELLRWVGLERRRSMAARAAMNAGWFGAGLAIGGGLALLLTPHNGPEMRRKLSRQARRAQKYVTEVTNGGESSASPQTH